MNNICITGRLTSDPVLRNTADGKPVASYRVAVNRSFAREGQPKADFFQVTAFGKAAEFVNNWFVKGSMIAVTGELRIEEYTTREGEKRIQPTIYANTQDFCGDKTASQQTAAPAHPAPQKPRQVRPKQQTLEEFVPVSEDDGTLPF